MVAEQANRGQHEAMTLDWRRLGLAFGSGCVAYLIVPDLGVPEVASLTGWVRAGVAGAVAGLTCREVPPPWMAAGVAGMVTMVGWVFVALSSGTAPASGLLGTLLAAAIAFGLSWLAGRADARLPQAGALVVVIWAALALSGVAPGGLQLLGAEARQAGLSMQPVPETYDFDGQIYLRTRDLMKQGSGYYEAFRQAVIGHANMDGSSLTSPFSFRQPLLFYMWRVLPGATPYHLWQWFLVFSLVALVLSYLVAVVFVEPGPALLAPIALLSFFTFFWWDGFWFTMTEPWAAFVGLAALATLLRRQWVASLLLLIVATATREFMVLLVPVWLAAWWFSGTREQRLSMWWFAFGSVLGPIAVVAAHVLLAPVYGGGSASLSAWSQGGLGQLLSALRFGWNFMPGFAWLAVALPLLTLAGAVMLKPRWMQVSMILLVCLPLLFLLVVSSGQWGLYWGAFFTPLAAAVAPSVLSRLMPSDLLISEV